MKFALFYEIPVARPWTPGKEHQAYKDTLEQAVLGDQMGFHAFWTVEHHFLEEYSHCSNPEVLYGAVAARTKNIRIGYGVRLLPKPYNHPIRTAESVAVLDLISDGRVDFGTGRSSTRAELEGFNVEPDDTRAMWREALGHIVGAWTEDEYQAQGEYWQMGAPRRVLPKPLQQPHPPIFGATSSLPGHEEIGQRGIGLCSFTVGLPPEQLAENIAMYRKGLAACEQPAGKFVNDTAATFTMVLCAPTNEEATEVARESFEWYPKYGGGLIASVAEWQEERGITGDALGTYQYTGETLKLKRDGVMGQLTIDYLRDSGSAVMGDPDACIAAAKRYEAVGCDLLLCLVNPYKIPHEKVMQTIELMGKHVLPEFVMRGRLNGKVALITGAASGLGLATAERFAKEGASVIGADVTAADGVRVLDVRDEGAIAALVDAIVAEHGHLDIVVNYAGVAGGGPVHLVSGADWDHVLEVNLKGTFLVNKHALRPMLEQKAGSIINVASVEGLQGTEGGSSYNASKAAVVMLTKNMAIDYGRAGIRVNAICPGFIDTPMFRAVMGSDHMAQFRDQYRDDHMLGRFGRAEEIAAAALFLASDDASFVTGVALPVDGGYLAGTRTGLSDLMGIV